MLHLLHTSSYIKDRCINNCTYIANYRISTCNSYFVAIEFKGGDYSQVFNANHLAYCMEHCQPAPLFYPDEFKHIANCVRSYLNITQAKITADNCKDEHCFCAYEWSRLE